MLEVIKIDSLKLSIPIHKVTYVDSTFCEEYSKIYRRTGEVDAHISLDKHKVDETYGIRSRIAVVNRMHGDYHEEHIEIQCNAKQLKSRYLEGISRSTIQDLYQYVIDLKIIYVKYIDFLDAFVSDIDLCLDTTVTPTSMIEANQEIFRAVKPELIGLVSRPYRRKDNVGIFFNKRENATPAKPHVKIYHKTLELENSSFKFADKFLRGINYQDIGRIEYTIKNSKHRRHLGLTFKTLRQLLELDLDKEGTFIFEGVLRYIEKRTIIRHYKDLSPTDRLMLYFINRCISHGDDKQIIFGQLEKFDVPTEKSRMKKKLKGLIEQVDEQEKLTANQEALNLLRLLRLDF